MNFIGGGALIVFVAAVVVAVNKDRMGQQSTSSSAESGDQRSVDAAPIAANCRYDYDTADKVESHDYGPFAPPVITTTPGEHHHYRIRLDIDTSKGTAKWSDGSNSPAEWTNGSEWKTSSGGSGKSFVKTDGKSVWFGNDYFKGDGSKDRSETNRFDVESGLLYDWIGRRWECQKAVNQFQ